MRYLLKYTFTTGLFINAITADVYSQAESRYEIGINAGAFIYQGDLTPSLLGSFTTPSFVFGLNAGRKINNKYTVRLDLNFGRLAGSDSKYSHPAWRQQRNFQFTATATEMLANLVWNLFTNPRKVNPYAFAGAGVSFLSIQRNYSRLNGEFFASEFLTTRLETDIQHALPRMVPVVPVGLGITIPVNRQFSVKTEASYRLMSTDYLDGFSQSANPARKDHYYKYSIGLNYSVKPKNMLGCPVVKF